jgi:hypothetical protein
MGKRVTTQANEHKKQILIPVDQKASLAKDTECLRHKTFS